MERRAAPGIARPGSRTVRSSPEPSSGRARPLGRARGAARALEPAHQPHRPSRRARDRGAATARGRCAEPGAARRRHDRGSRLGRGNSGPATRDLPAGLPGSAGRVAGAAAPLPARRDPRARARERDGPARSCRGAGSHPSEGVVAQAIARPIRPSAGCARGCAAGGWLALADRARRRPRTTRIYCRDAHFATRRRAGPSARSGSHVCASPIRTPNLAAGLRKLAASRRRRRSRLDRASTCVIKGKRLSPRGIERAGGQPEPGDARRSGVRVG